MTIEEQVNAAREMMAANRADGKFASPNATVQFKPLTVKLLSINSDGTQVHVEYPGGVREVIDAGDLESIGIV
ncbi:MAG: hypothetical protein KYX66_18860 [Blastomonas fulva]|uniref:hypothetical protein n=1 Tax=Blastomonas fulva TaxID=1550728 RepID=UPI0024E228A3|nr:hypothetical protein [Blastomonas fulva]MDK2758790.1 hypothetical protein [Blastomonas fulva]